MELGDRLQHPRFVRMNMRTCRYLWQCILFTLVARRAFIQLFKKKNCLAKFWWRSRTDLLQFSNLCKCDYKPTYCHVRNYIFGRSIVKEKQENLVELNKDLESKSLTLNWDSFRNPSSKGSVNHLPLSQYLELIADILFQLDVSITSMFQYYDALDLHDVKSYEHLMHSFGLSTEIVDFMKEFSIKSATLFNCWTGN